MANLDDPVARAQALELERQRRVLEREKSGLAGLSEMDRQFLRQWAVVTVDEEERG